MYLFKLAELFEEKYNIHHGVDPNTGAALKPKFEPGDIVKTRSNKICKYLTQAPWIGPDMALLHEVGTPIQITNPLGKKRFNYIEALEDWLVLVEKKNK